MSAATDPAATDRAATSLSVSERFARAIAASKRVRWDIDADVIRGRAFDASEKFLPDGLTLMGEFPSLSEEEKRFLGQIQGRTYAHMFALVERFITAKILELSRDHWLGDQSALEAMIRFGDEEMRHQELFRRIDLLAAQCMPAGYQFVPDANAVARNVLSAGSWAVIALTLLIELFTQLHYRDSIDPDADLSPLFKDVFLFHWKEESQHAAIDELEWERLDAQLTRGQRDRAVDEFLNFLIYIDGLLRAQAAADAGYFATHCGRPLAAGEGDAVEGGFLKAYRDQYLISGAQHPHFVKVLTSLINEAQEARFQAVVDDLVRLGGAREKPKAPSSGWSLFGG